MKTDQEALALGSRRRIHDFVKEHPGTHLRELARLLELPLGTALYHLDYLVNREILVARQDGRYKRFFLRHDLGRREKDHVTVLRHNVPRRIVQAILPGGPMTQRELCAAIGVSRSTLSFHLGQLVQQEILDVEERRPEKLYRLAEPDVASRILATYAASFEPPRAPESETRAPAPTFIVPPPRAEA